MVRRFATETEMYVQSGRVSTLYYAQNVANRSLVLYSFRLLTASCTLLAMSTRKCPKMHYWWGILNSLSRNLHTTLLLRRAVATESCSQHRRIPAVFRITGQQLLAVLG